MVGRLEYMAMKSRKRVRSGGVMFLVKGGMIGLYVIYFLAEQR